MGVEKTFHQKNHKWKKKKKWSKKKENPFFLTMFLKYSLAGKQNQDQMCFYTIVCRDREKGE